MPVGGSTSRQRNRKYKDPGAKRVGGLRNGMSRSTGTRPLGSLERHLQGYLSDSTGVAEKLTSVVLTP